MAKRINPDNKFYKALKQFRAFLVTEELKLFHGNISKAAASLGIHRNIVTRIIKENAVDVHNIKKAGKEISKLVQQDNPRGSISISLPAQGAGDATGSLSISDLERPEGGVLPNDRGED